MILALLGCLHDFPDRSDDFDGDGIAADEDCDDTDANVGILLWYIDNDGDGCGGVEVASCEPPKKGVATGGDCDDGDPRRFDGNLEVCDQADNDCNDEIDDGAPPLPEGVDVCGDGVDTDCDGSCDECCFEDGEDGPNDVAQAAFTLLSVRVGSELVSGNFFPEPSLAFAAGSPSAGTVYAVPGAAMDLDHDPDPRVVDVDKPADLNAIAILQGRTEGDQFGAALTTLANEAGTTDLLVGAPLAENEGAVYSFSGPLAPGSVIIANDVAFHPDAGGTFFGSNVLTGHDFDDDGFSDVVVSGIDEVKDKTGATYPGAVWVFFDSPSTLGSQQITGSDDADGFGGSLAAGDLDGDAADDLVVGRTGAATSEVCVFLGQEDVGFRAMGASASDFAFTSFLNAANLGSALALGDFNDDGHVDVAAGANTPGEIGTPNATVRVFLNVGEWTSGNHDIGLDENDMTFIGDLQDLTGTALVARDFDLDGVDDLLIGSPAAATGGDTYLVRMPQTGGVEPPGDTAARWSSGVDGADLGSRLGADTFGSDEWPDVLLAAPGAHSVYVWKSAGIW